MGKVTGIVKRYNQVEDRMPGIQLDDNLWYNANKVSEKYVANLENNIGAMVELLVDDKRVISHCKVIQEEPPQEDAPKSPAQNYLAKKYNNPEKDALIVRQVSMKCAVELACAHINKGIELTPEYLKVQAEEINKWIMGGNKKARI